MEFPTRAYLTCADVFEALGEAEPAHAAIEAGYHEVIRRADRISNADWRESFLDRVPEHRAIIDLRNRMIDAPAKPADTHSYTGG